MTESQSSKNSSLLALDIGSVNTKAHYFGVVDGKYRFLASGEALSGIGVPAGDLRLGATDALKQIEEITGHSFFYEDGSFSFGDNGEEIESGTMVSTFSGGPPLKVIALGLLDSVSLESASKLLKSNYCQVAAQFSLNERSPEKLVDAVSQERPDLILMAGGTNDGASRSVLRMANYLAIALELLPREKRAQILFVGNENLQTEIENLLGSLCDLHFAANIRPQLDEELLGPASEKFANIYLKIQSRKLNGLEQIQALSDGGSQPTARAFGRAIRFLSHVIDYPKGMLGIDLGASNTIIAAAFGGQLSLQVHPNLGLGAGLSTLLAESALPKISRWLSQRVGDVDLLDSLYNKPLSPQSLPVNEQDLAIEQAAAREVVHLAMARSLPALPKDVIYPLGGSPPWFDRILVSGNTISKAPRAIQSLLMVLDAVQPVGIATIILDQNNLTSAIGASAEVNPLLAVQVLESTAFINLGTVISPVGSASAGSVVLRIQIVRDGEKQDIVEVEQGKLQSIPIAMNSAVDVYVQPMQNMNVGLGPGRGGWVRRVVGGKFGLIVDTRGRPLILPEEDKARRELLDQWRHSLSEAQY